MSLGATVASPLVCTRGVGCARAALRIFPFALTALGSLPRTQRLRFAKCLCLILIQAIQSMFSGWQASGVASPARVADHISAGPGDVKKTGVCMRSASGGGKCSQPLGKQLS